VTHDFANSEAFRALPRKRVGAGALITNPSNEVLLVKPTYKGRWEIPGGLVEVGESPRAAATRELREELGLDVEIGRLLVLDWDAPTWLPDDGLMLVFAAAPFDTSRIRLATEELSRWEWCDRQALRERLIDYKARRIEAALDAQASGAFTELEDGIPVGTDPTS
jgi:8-oxo-dGTP diphosphatase